MDVFPLQGNCCSSWLSYWLQEQAVIKQGLSLLYVFTSLFAFCCELTQHKTLREVKYMGLPDLGLPSLQN